jgi:hypothetical protein
MKHHGAFFRLILTQHNRARKEGRCLPYPDRESVLVITSRRTSQSDTKARTMLQLF